MTHIQYIAAVTFFHFLAFSQLVPSISAGNGISLKLIPLFSPASPLYPGNLSHSERIQKMVEISEARVKYLTSTLSHNDTMDPQNSFLPIDHRRYYAYFVNISLGSPRHSQFLAVDTGSGLIWTQCQPCINCYNQTVPIFDPHTSTSYSKLHVDDPRCKWPIFQHDHEECSYAIRNLGESQTEGVASTETFTFHDNKGQKLVLSNILFGCSNNNIRIPFVDTKISGVLGLNRAPPSLGNQLRGKFEGSSRFTYCLHPSQTATSLLKFGDNAVFPIGKEYQTIQVLENDLDHYLLNLEDISVGNQPIGFPNGTFDRRNKKGGCFLDSGSIFSFMQSVPYRVVMKRFDEHFTLLGRQRVPPPPEAKKKFEYCYNYDDDFKGGLVPMTYHFKGPAELEINVEQLYVVIRDAFCVTIVSSEDFAGDEFTVVGAWHQQNTRFVFDLDERLIQFAPEDCSQDKK